MDKNIFDEIAKQEQPLEQEEVQQQIDIAASFGSDAAAAEEATATADLTKKVVQELLKTGWLYQNKKPKLYRQLLLHLSEVERLIEPFDFKIRLDDIRGAAVLVVTEQGDWTHPLVRKQRLNLEQSLVVAILRQHFMFCEQEHGIGATVPSYSLQDLKGHTLIYFGNSGSEEKDEKRITTILEQLYSYGLVGEINKYGEFEILPIITHLATPETLDALKQDFVEALQKGES